ncbi:hypothetical protein GCM10023321_11500 [Pseudonocardia eucalypti]|uniref:Core-binding (CB) domain-containing protein n=1 Tax=Pseudonocardia eucalypti TaxID=648755 RepID=A0ABP9PQR6_9PSEU
MTMATPGDAPSVDATVAGFIAWLARRHRQTDEERERCVSHVARFLDWRSEQPPLTVLRSRRRGGARTPTGRGR